ncbi:MAG TPA: hypothetical protein VEH49_03015, partial [Methylomirabilota bacterium]|nr:hypothetical protein [Methylomirabilota bacterium]
PRPFSLLEEQGRKLVHRRYALGTAGEDRLIMELILTRIPIPGRREPGECRLVRDASLCYSTVRGLRVSKRARSFPCPVARPILPD